MKVCFLLGGFYSPGGIGRVVSVLTRLLSEDGRFDVTALSYLRQDAPKVYPVSESVHEAFLLERYESMAQLMLTGGERRLRRFLREREMDVLVACGALFYPISVRAVRGTKTKCICWEHTNPEISADYRMQRFSRDYGARHADCTVVLTDRTLRYYQETLGMQNVLRIYNPVDAGVLQAARGYDPNSRKIISVGRLTYPKHFQAAVEVAAKVLPKHPDWSWDIFGEGEERPELEQRIRAAGLQGRMTLRGRVDDLYDRYSDYGVMVMTSRYEGFPMTLLEGLGNGLPLVSFDISTGPDEIITDGVNGRLLPEGDVSAMAEALDALLSDGQLRIKMSAASLGRCGNFTEKTALEAWAALLLQTAAN